PAAPKRCTAGSGRRPLEKDPHSGNLASGLPVLLHGAVRGRFLRVRITLTESVLRIAVTDARGERLPCEGVPAWDDTQGRGLLLVRTLSARWGVGVLAVGKTVWCELDVTEGGAIPS
ncbi:ATP-binding protein, partial [Streptomyces celluloflavus]|uniref:ATP-binding protein n=1 Tax=Streptomyces celluloflavus TaxID=58344 RepID=UPI0037BA060B